jgi:hypothetical protein
VKIADTGELLGIASFYLVFFVVCSYIGPYIITAVYSEKVKFAGIVGMDTHCWARIFFDFWVALVQYYC